MCREAQTETFAGNIDAERVELKEQSERTEIFSG